VGIVATAAMSICPFQLAHGREARMYGPMELIGVAIAVVADSWLRAPSRRHAAMIGALTFVGMMTHVSTILVAIGLITLAGRRTDAEAWRWRAAIAAGSAAWAFLWGGSFLVQARGGHSSWIPHTTPARFVVTVGALVADRPDVSVVIVAAIVGGIIICRRRDRLLASVLVCCFVIPATVAGLVGWRAPVLLDRTLTVASWGPLLALGYVMDALSRRTRALGVAAVAVTALTILSSVPDALHGSGPTAILNDVERVARAGDVIAVQPPARGVELDWSLGVRSDDGPARAIRVPGVDHAIALALTDRRPSGRVWLLHLTTKPLDVGGSHLCAPTRHYGATQLLCLHYDFPRHFPRSSPPTIAAIFPDHHRSVGSPRSEH
jgi:hypothetical protein